MKHRSNVDRGNVIGGMVWVFGERILAQLVSMLITIVLARLLDPEHYGVISIVTICITFLNVFVTSGFGTALVQKKEANEQDFNTAFWLSFGVSLVLYTGLFFSTPFIAEFYDMPLLRAVLRVMGLRLPLAAFNNIQRSYIQRSMKFQKFFWATVSSTVISGLVGVVLAYRGFGVWALVGQYLSNTVLSTFLLFTVCPWKPKFQFSVDSGKATWSFGWKVLVTQLIGTLENDIRSLVVGKVFGSADLAYYDQGKKYPSLLVTNINSSIDSVMLSAYSKEQEDGHKLLTMLRRSVRVGIYVLMPVLLGFAAVTEEFVSLLLTDKWLPAVPFMQVFCLVYLTRPLECSCRQALLAIGKSGANLIAMIVINVVAIAGVIVSVFVLESVLAIALFSLLTTLISLVCFLALANYYLGYKFKMQLHDFIPSLLAGLIMFAIVWLVGLLQMNSLLQLVVQVLVGAAIYVGYSVVFKLEPFYYLLNMIKGYVRNK